MACIHTYTLRVTYNRFACLVRSFSLPCRIPTSCSVTWYALDALRTISKIAFVLSCRTSCHSLFCLELHCLVFSSSCLLFPSQMTQNIEFLKPAAPGGETSTSPDHKFLHTTTKRGPKTLIDLPPGTMSRSVGRSKSTVARCQDGKQGTHLATTNVL